jgi:hypothetical protein
LLTAPIRDSAAVEPQRLAVVDSVTDSRDDAEYGFNMPAFDFSVYASLAAKAPAAPEPALAPAAAEAAPADTKKVGLGVGHVCFSLPCVCSATGTPGSTACARTSPTPMND